MPKSIHPYSISLIGVGSAGCTIVKELINRQLHDYDYVVIDSDVQVLLSLNIPDKIQLERKPMRGFLCGPAPEVWREAANKQLK